MEADPFSTSIDFLNILWAVQLGTGTIVLFLVIILLLILTALIAGSEVAYFSLSSKEINIIKQSKGKSYKRVLHLIENPKRLLATILIANSLLSVGVILTTNSLITTLFPLENLHSFMGMSPAVLLIFIQVVGVTFFLVLFGEVLPKVYATQNNLRLSLFTAPLLAFLDRIFSPLSKLLLSSTSFLEGKFIEQHSKNFSHEDVENAIELTVGHSTTKEEVNIFKGILRFNEITVKQIMCSRVDFTALNAEMPFSDVKELINQSGYSRLPVYEDDLDTIIGLIHTKDLLPHIHKENFDWKEIMRPVHFVPETKPAEELLKEFQQTRNHIAIVVDEFGGTSGLVTMEDIMEEIVGEIKDEFDDDEIEAKKIDNHNYIFEGKTLINDVCRFMTMPVDTFDEVKGESDSLAGLILELSGKFPNVNEKINYRHYQFTVLQLDNKRIQKIKLSILPEDGE